MISTVCQFVTTNDLMWETMVFGGEFDQEQERCGGSREQAEAMHLDMVRKVMEGKK